MIPSQYIHYYNFRSSTYTYQESYVCGILISTYTITMGRYQYSSNSLRRYVCHPSIEISSISFKQK